MTKRREKKIVPHNKEGWKKLDEIEVFENRLEGTWKQRGPYIVNTGSKLDYGIYIGMDKKLVGVDEHGKPVLESR